MNPRTGRDTECTVRHVITFGFYVDGNYEVPSDILLGNHFWEDPTLTGSSSGPRSTPASIPTVQTRSRRAAARQAVDSPPLGTQEAISTDRAGAPTPPSPALDQAQFVDVMDALIGVPIPSTHDNRVSHDAVAPPPPNPSTRLGRRGHLDGASSFDMPGPSMRILAALAEQPDLLQHYARQLSSQGPEPKRPRYVGVSDLQAADDTSSRQDRQHSFRP